MRAFDVTVFDVAGVTAYLSVILWIAYRAARRVETPEDYFLAGRTLTWPFIGFSLFATNISSSSLIGLAGDAYRNGIAVYNYEWSAVVILVLFIIFFLPVYLKALVFTIPEYLERRFDARSRLAVSALTILGNILLEAAGTLYSGALVLRLFFPDLPFGYVVAMLALLSGLYTAAGGLRADVYTDVLQVVLLLIGALLVSTLAFAKVGSWSAVVAAYPPEQLRLIRSAADPVLPWPALLTGIPLLGIYFWCTNQYMVQRTLGARTLEEGRRGALFAGLLKIPILFLLVFPGLFARVLYPDIERGDLVFPTLVSDLLPPGVRSVVLIALVAALMSTLDSTLNAVATLVTMDFVKKYRPDTSSRRLVTIGRLTTLVVMVLGALWAPRILQFGSLWQYLQSVLAYLGTPIVACFLGGLFWRRANGPGAFATLVAGLAQAALLVLLRPGIHFLYISVIIFAGCVLMLIIVSLLTAPPDPEQVKAYAWSKALLQSDTLPARWYADYRLQAVVLVALTAIVVAVFS